MLEAKQFLDILEIFKPIVINLETFYRKFTFERIDIELSDLVVMDIQLLKQFQILKAVNLDDFVLGSF